MTDVTDNPIVEPVENKFYGTAAEPEPEKPTEPEAVTTEEDQAPPQEVASLDKPAEEIAEESEQTEDTEDEDENALFVEIDGEEHNLEDVKKWRDGHMMQADYTRKTQTLAKDRDDFEAESKVEREQLTEEKTKVLGMHDQLVVLVLEDEEINWSELKDEDPDRYIELKERADKRREMLAEVNIARNTPADDPAMIADEQRKLFESNPEWLNEEKEPTDVYKAEMKLISEYAAKTGFEPDEFARLTKARYLNTILKAAKYDELQKKAEKIKGKKDKIPVVTKPKAAKTSAQPKPIEEIFYGSG